MEPSQNKADAPPLAVDAKERQREARRKEQDERNKLREEHLKSAAIAAERRDDWRKRWQLSLAVANGAALVGLSSVLLDPSKRPTDAAMLFALLFSAWSFAIAGALTTAIPISRSRNYEAERRAEQIRAEEAYHGYDDNVPIWTSEHDEEPSGPLRERHRTTQRRWHLFVTWSERVGAVGFAVGVLVPLVAMTLSTLLSTLR